MFNNRMSQSDIQYTKLRWLLTIAGLVLYVVDICTDITLALQYFQEKHLVWSGLTLAFVLMGLLVTQIFSYSWYRDDMNNTFANPEGKSTISGMSKDGLTVLHLFGMGIFTRYYHLLQKGFGVVWTASNSYMLDEMRDEHQKLFGLATDLSMLKLFEAFLESVPQLLLQLYILLDQKEVSILRCSSMVFSFFNIAWALVDYRRCLRRSLPQIQEMPSGLPTLIYLIYKLFTITSLILSYSLLLRLCTYSTIALTIIWLVATIWTHCLQTDFCTSKNLEFLYRAVIGFILTFTFFNVKGQDTRMEMSVYYFLYTLINITAPTLLALLGPELQTATFLLTVSGFILGGSVLGLVCLMLYYVFLHPRGKVQVADEVDGLAIEKDTTRRIGKFLQP